MIVGLHGAIEAKATDTILVNVQGVVYRVGTSTTTLSETGSTGDRVHLHTHLFVREDQLSLYGFASIDELRLFETLITVTGVGPRLACAVLSRFPTDQLHHAIATENATLLATVPGIGRKTAARLLLELRGKLPTLTLVEGGATPIVPVYDDDVLEALRSLGYSHAEAQTALIASHSPAEAPVEERLLAALRVLGEG